MANGMNIIWAAIGEGKSILDASGGFWLVRFGGVAGRFCLVVLAVCV